MITYYRKLPTRVAVTHGSLQCCSCPGLCLTSEDVRSSLYIFGDAKRSRGFEPRVSGAIRGLGCKASGKAMFNQQCIWCYRQLHCWNLQGWLQKAFSTTSSVFTKAIRMKENTIKMLMGTKACDCFAETCMQQQDFWLPKIHLCMHLCEPLFIF